MIKIVGGGAGGTGTYMLPSLFSGGEAAGGGGGGSFVFVSGPPSKPLVVAGGGGGAGGSIGLGYSHNGQPGAAGKSG